MPLPPVAFAVPPPPPDPSEERRQARRWLQAPLLLFVGLAAGLGLWLQGHLREPPSPGREAAAAAPAVAAPAAAPAPRPAGDADAEARAALGPASGETGWSGWLTTPGLLVRAVAAVAAVAEGDSPRPLLAFLAPSGAFAVVERDGGAWVAPHTFARYDGVGRVARSLDAAALAHGYRMLAPFVDAAYAELAPPGARFDAALSRALQRLSAVPVPDGPVRVVPRPRGAPWDFADPRLQALSAAEKHLVRLGPANQRAVQAKLRELQEALSHPTTTAGTAGEG